MHSLPALEAFGLRQQKTVLISKSDSYEQETEATPG